MKKIIFLLVASLLISTHAFAVGVVDKLFDVDQVEGTSTTITSRAVNVGSAESLGYWIKLGQSATPEPVNIRLTMEVSPTGLDGTWATHSTVRSSWDSAVTATAGTITVPDMKYVRFVAEGNSGNATGTTITMYMFRRE